MLRRFLFFVFSLSVATLPAAAQQPPGSDTAARATEDLRQEMDGKLLNLERRVYDQSELNLRRVEYLEERLDSSGRYLDRVLLTFGLILFLGFFLLGNILGHRQRMALQRLNYTTHDAEGIMRDIKREISRPELEHLRISQMLRYLLRQLRDRPDTPFNKEAMSQLRNAAADPFLPASLHFIARVLTAEQDGHWTVALQMLDQLREMDSKDPDVLLHLSHVHTQIAARTLDVKSRRSHQRWAYQYYAQFSSAVKVEGVEQDVPPMPRSGEAAAAERAAEKKPIPSSSAQPMLRQPTPAGRPAGGAPARPDGAAPTPPVRSISATPSSAMTQATATAAKQAARRPSPSAAAAAAAKSAAAGSTAAAEKISFKDKMKNLAQAAKANANDPRSFREKFKDAADTAVKKSGNAWAKSVDGIRSLRSVMAEESDEELPFLPLPNISEVPDNGDKRTINMWRSVRKGDETMAAAAAAKSLRERNRIIDNAIIFYAEAQAHKTNEALYYNWGLALLAKALHVEEKKRSAFFNGAIDKFLAGNVVAPNFFDFHLASLYAIIGDSKECFTWLKKSKESDTLNREALQHAPDFDNVREEPWFDSFLTA